MEIFKSRKFWLLLIDFVAIVGAFVLRSYAPQYQDAIVLIVGAAQPLVMYLLAKFTEDDTVAKTIEALGKTVPLILLALILASVFGASAAVAADPPQPWMYAATQYSGYSTADAVQASFTKYRNVQAQLHQYTSEGIWKATYDPDATNWMRAHGCASCSIVGGVYSFKILVDAPVFMFDAGASAVPY